MKFFYCCLFQKISNLVHYSRFFFWTEMNFRWQFLLQGLREKKIGIPSQSLKYSDPFVEASTSLHQSSYHLNIWRLIRDKKNLFTSLRAYGNFSREIWVGISLKNIFFFFIITTVRFISVGAPVFLLAVVFVSSLPAPPPNDVVCLTGGNSEWADIHLERL